MTARQINFWLFVANFAWVANHLVNGTWWSWKLLGVNMACGLVNLACYLRAPTGVVRGGQLRIEYRDCR